MTLILKGFSVFLILSWPFVAVISVMALGGPGATNDKEGIRDIILVLYYPVFITSVYWITGSSLFGISGRTLVLISVIIITLGLHTSGYFKLASNAYRGINNEGYRSEEHTSELQSRGHLVCRLLLEKKKTNN